MKISIVTISFNQGQFLEETLNSVLGQDYPDLEYIVVDPGSTDGSRDIIERYRDRLSAVLYDRDLGPADGLNKGFAQATGEVLGFLNSDDILLPGALRAVAEAFERDSELELLSGHSRIIDAEGRHVRNGYTDVFHARAYAYNACMISQLSTFFRADLFRQSGGFNIENRVAWDAELFGDLFRSARKLRVLDRFLSAFRIHPDAITGGARRSEALLAFHRAQFRALIGRDWTAVDDWLRWAYLARKYCLEPRSFWERLRHGPVYGRFARK